MRVLSVSKGGREVSTTPLTSRALSIGRSPACQVVLRAPGVKPLHMKALWNGQGKFDADKGSWTLSDSQRQLSLTEKGIVLDGFEFKLREDPLTQSNIKY